MYDTSKTLQKEDIFNRILDQLRPKEELPNKYPDMSGNYFAICPFCKNTDYGRFVFNKREFECTFCGERGTFDELVQKLGVSDKSIVETIEIKGLTLEEYSKDKDIPIDFLKSLQISERKFNGESRLLIPYFDLTGNKIRVRYRLSMKGNSQFQWSKGTLSVPYGIWMLAGLMQSCSEKWGYPNTLIIVEGESDAQTLWHYGFPALGVPGAIIWRSEWVQYLQGYKVYVWHQPDKGGQAFVDRVAKDMPEINVISSPDDRKDISDCHINGDNVPELLKKLIDNAVPYSEILRQRRQEESKQLTIAAEPIFKSDILNMVAEYCAENAIVGEGILFKLVYIALTSRVLGRPISIVLKGPSSSGKSFTLDTVLKLFPQSAFYVLSSMSEKALIYMNEPLIHRFLIIYEAPGINSDFLAGILRSLLSEGCIRYVTVDSTDKGIESREIIKEGPTGFITTTIAGNLDPETETRMFSLNTRDDSDQTKRIMLKIGEHAQGIDRPKKSPESLVAFQSWVEKCGRHDVVIPFAMALADSIDPTALRLRRDFTAIINLIETVVIIYQHQREVDDSGRIIATIEDYKIVYELISDIIDEGIEKSISPTIRQTVEAVERLLPSKSDDDDDDDEFDGFGFTNKSKGPEKPSFVDIPTIADELGLDRSTTSRRVMKAIELEFLENTESRKGQRARIKLGRLMPADRSVLPTPEQLKNILDGLS